jgi:hypothetical protein
MRRPARYWQLWTHAGFVIADLPDSVTAGALTTAVAKTSAFKSVEPHDLVTQQQLRETVDLARDAAQVYEAPASQPEIRAAARVRVLAAVAGTVSYLHMHVLVELHGQPGW